MKQVVENDKPFDLNPVRDDLEPVLQPILLPLVILRDSTAGSDPAILFHPRQHEIQNLPTHVVEIHLHIIRRLLLQPPLEIAPLVVQAHIRSQALHPPALGIVARHSDHALDAKHVLRNLYGHAPRRAGGSADDDDTVPCARPCDLLEAIVGRQSREAERAQELRLAQPRDPVDFSLQPGRVQNDVVDPPRRAEDEVAPGVFGGPGVEDFGDVSGPHDFSHLNRRDVEASGVHTLGDPSSLGRVVGDVGGFEEDLVGLEGWEGLFL